MAIEDMLKGNLALGLAVGVGAVMLAPILAPVVASIAKPLAKSAIKTGLILYEKGRETSAELSEVLEDLVAEARAELAGTGVNAADADRVPAAPEAEPPQTS